MFMLIKLESKKCFDLWGYITLGHKFSFPSLEKIYHLCNS